jgi:hypothetical protein
MNRHVIAGRYGSADRVTIRKQPDERITKLNLLSPRGKLNYGIGDTLENLAKFGIFPSEIGLDLMVFAAHVQAADTYILRSSESQNSWTRELRLVVPVSDPDKWTAAASTLKRTLDFLTGDIWLVSFRRRPASATTLVPTGSTPLAGNPFDRLQLFSGGLDSLIGAIDALEDGRTPLLISHSSDGSTSGAQQACFDELKRQYPRSQFDRLRVWTNFPDVSVRGGTEKEKTTRGRSFLFFSIGIFAGTGFNTPFTLQAPENGLIALNIPMDPLRLGSHSTRTTHPFYIARWNEILEMLDIPGRIENPYWNKTKGEMAASCGNKALLRDLVPKSLSCSSPTKERWRGKGVQHCGYCLPCLIRRAALEKGLGAGVDTTTYTLKNLKKGVLNTEKAEGQQVRSFQFAVERLNRNPNLARLLVHTSGSLSDESTARQAELVGVYQRGMDEVNEILQGVRTKAK